MSERVANWPQTEVTARRSRGEFALRCSSCGCERTWSDVLPPNTTRTRAERAGWRIQKKWKRATCPTCTESEQKEVEIMAEAKDPKPFKQAFAYLLEHYDDDAKCYEADWSDERIAKAIKRSEKFVAAIREEHFGPAEDPRIGNLREEVLRIRRTTTKEIGELRSFLDELERKANAELDEVGKRAASLSARPRSG